MDFYDVAGILTLGYWKRPDIVGHELPQQYRIGETTPKKFNFRPQTLNQYVGQECAKANVKLAMDVINNLHKPAHFILAGHAGHGKTTLAFIIGNMLGYKVHYFIGGSFDIVTLLNFLKSNEQEAGKHILFIDEIHNLKKDVAEYMYPIIEDYELGENKAKLKPFILLGATTEIYSLEKTVKPFLDRCHNKIILEKYTAKDIKKILKQYNAQLYNQEVPERVYDIIANNVRYTPRIAFPMFEKFLACRDINLILKASRIIDNSLTDIDLKVLEHLLELETAKGKQVPVAQETLAIVAGVDKGDYKSNIEPFLISEGYLSRTSRGRVITEQGKKIVQEL